MIRYLDVCSGLSASTVAWSPLGWQCAGYSEIEPFPRAVLEQRHGAVAVDWEHRHTGGSNVTPLFGDFTKIEAHHVGPIDLLVGGTPCQAFSVAGKRLGLDDPRGNLAIEFLALARRLQPRWLVWENVPGVLSSWSGEPQDEAIAEWTETNDFAAFLDLFRQCGYRGCYRVLDAQYVRVAGFGRAVPQRRRRVFLVGHLGDVARAVPVLFDPDSLRGNNPPRREAGQGLAEAAGGRAGIDREPVDLSASASVTSKWAKGTGGPAGDECQNLIATPVAFRTSPNNGAWETGDRIDALTTGTDRTAHLVAMPVADTLSVGANQTTGFASEVIAIQERAVSENPNAGPQGKGWQPDIAYTLEARHHVQAVAFDTTQITSGTNGSNPAPGDPCHPLAASAHPPAIATMPIDLPADQSEGRGWSVRRLTPRECERLQGFPDDFTLVAWRGGKPAVDGPRYKAIGNSMAVNVMRWIGTRIDLIDSAVAAGGVE